MNTFVVDRGTNVIEERVALAARGHKLDGRLAYVGDTNPKFSALVSGPHPFMGGEIDNNVVRALSTGLAACNGLVLTFDYSGVGNSEGGPQDWQRAASQFWESGAIDCESTWVSDAETASKALADFHVTPTIEIGYSFGCWVVAEMTPASNAVSRVLISPNPNQHDFQRLSTCGSPLLVLHSENDFACRPSDIHAWFDGVRKPKTLKMIEAGEHFFRGQEHRLVAAVVESLSAQGVV